MNEKELLPCPFCGGTVRIVVCDDEGNFHGDEYENDPWSGLGYMICHNVADIGHEDEDCPLAQYEGEGPMGGWIYDNREEAIEAWNKRYVPPAKTLGDAELLRTMKLCAGESCCSTCKFRKKLNCVNELLREAIDLFERQNAEIKRLKVGEYRNISKTIQNARIEGIEDFAKRLKDEIDVPKELDGAVIDFVIDIIDICVQDMTKEDEHDGT